VRDALGLNTEIVGVVAAEARAYSLSLEAGRPIASKLAEKLPMVWHAGDVPRFTQPVLIEDFNTSANSLGVR
jgi:hypothetical protein